MLREMQKDSLIDPTLFITFVCTIYNIVVFFSPVHMLATYFGKAELAYTDS